MSCWLKKSKNQKFEHTKQTSSKGGRLLQVRFRLEKTIRLVTAVFVWGVGKQHSFWKGTLRAEVPRWESVI